MNDVSQGIGVGGLRDEICVPCRNAGSAIADGEIEALQIHVPDWQVIDIAGVKRLQRIFKFKNFTQAMEFSNRVGQMAEAEDHHPALLIEWGQVTVSWWTHKVKGLHRNDFILAARTDDL